MICIRCILASWFKQHVALFKVFTIRSSRVPPAGFSGSREDAPYYSSYWFLPSTLHTCDEVNSDLLTSYWLRSATYWDGWWQSVLQILPPQGYRNEEPRIREAPHQNFKDWYRSAASSFKFHRVRILGPLQSSFSCSSIFSILNLRTSSSPVTQRHHGNWYSSDWFVQFNSRLPDAPFISESRTFVLIWRESHERTNSDSLWPSPFPRSSSRKTFAEWSSSKVFFKSAFHEPQPCSWLVHKDEINFANSHLERKFKDFARGTTFLLLESKGSK